MTYVKPSVDMPDGTHPALDASGPGAPGVSAGTSAEESSSVVVSEPRFGQRLRAARERRGESLDACGAVLHLPTRVLRQLEADAYDGTDSSVYLASYIRSYGEHLGLEAAVIGAELKRIQRVDTPLVVTGGISHSRFLFGRYATAATYVVLTAVIVVPMIWLGVHGTLSSDLSHLAPLDAAPVAQQDARPQQAPTPATNAAPRLVTPSVVVPPVVDQPLMASMAPFPTLTAGVAAASAAPAAAAPAAGDHRLSLSLSAPSWVEVIAQDGSKLEYGLLPAGSNKTYYTDQPVSVLIGNVSGADLSIDGNPVALADASSSNVARLSVRIEDGKASVASR